MDLATWTSVVSPAPRPVDASAYRFFDDSTEPMNVLVAEVDGLVAGYVKLRSTSRPSQAHVLEIHGLAVDPGRQGEGVGRRLLEAAVQEAVARGARKLTLRVLGLNATARRLYERSGFLIEGVLRAEFLLDGRYVDDVLMARELVTWVCCRFG